MSLQYNGGKTFFREMLLEIVGCRIVDRVCQLE